MSYTVRFTPAAAKDLQRLFDFLAEKDMRTAKRARTAIAKGIEFLRTFPFSCRKASPEHPFLRELIISVKSNARSDSFASSPARGRGLRRGSEHDNFQFIDSLVMFVSANGYVALFEIEDSQTVTVLAIRHQREEDFF